MIGLYTVRDSLSIEVQSILAVQGFVAGEFVWCHGIRRGTLGEYGRISKTYESRPGYRSPQPNIVENMPMRYFAPFLL